MSWQTPLRCRHACTASVCTPVAPVSYVTSARTRSHTASAAACGVRLRLADLLGQRRQLLVERGARRGQQQLVPAVDRLGHRQVVPGRRAGGGHEVAGRQGLHSGRRGHLEPLVGAVHVERRDDRAPVVLVAVGARRRPHLDPRLQDRLVRLVARRHPGLVVGRAHLARVRETGLVPDLQPPARRPSLTLDLFACDCGARDCRADLGVAARAAHSSHYAQPRVPRRPPTSAGSSGATRRR